MIKNLEAIDLDNYILTHNRELESERPFSKVKIISEKCSFVKKVYCKLFESWHIRNKNEVVDYINELKPDVVHAHFGPNGIRIYKLLKRYNINIPLVVSFHGMDINVLPKKDSSYLKLLLQMNLDENVTFTSPSKFLKNKMTNIGINTTNIHVIHNAYNEIFTRVKKNNYWKYGDRLNLLHIGRFTEVKGQVYLIKALEKVVNIYPNTKLTLIGYGDLETELKKLVSKLGLIKHIIFLNQVEHRQLPSIMSKFDIYLQPSIVANDGAEESLSVSTIEAQAIGIPAIVSDIGGLKEVVLENITGYLVKDKDVDAISSKIIHYIDHIELFEEHSINSRNHVQSVFNAKTIIEQWYTLYEKRVINDI